MIQYLEREEIDDKKWDECVRQSFNGMVYGYSWFLDIVAENWGGLIDDHYNSVFPLPYKEKFGVKYVYQPFFTQQLGLFSKELISEEVISAFINSIPVQFKRIELNLNTLNKMDNPGFKLIPQLNHELDLINPYESIYNNYSTNLKRNLKKGESNNLTVLKSIKPEGVIEMFRNARGRHIPHLKEAHYNTVKRIAYTSMYKGKSKVYGVFDETNELCAGAFFIISNKKAIFLFSGLSDHGRSLGAMPFLIDTFIKHHVNRHLTFDFDGSNEPDLARFYKSFGSRKLIYNRLYMDRMPPMTGMLADALLWARKLIRY